MALDLVRFGTHRRSAAQKNSEAKCALRVGEAIVLKHGVVTLVGAIAAGSAVAAHPPPAVLYEPAFRMPYKTALVKFEPLAASTWANCTALNYMHNTTPVWFIFGRADDGKGATYFAVSGYEISNQPPASSRGGLSIDGLGLVFRVAGKQCLEIGGVQETFSARYFEETPQEVLQLLAVDMAERYRIAFGGAAKLRAEFKRHRVKLDPEALELNAAFAAFLK